jgi:trehalose synthase
LLRSDTSILGQVQLQSVNVGSKTLGDYATIASRGLLEQIRALAEPLAGKRVLHLSATAFGGGVAEINYTLIPLMRDAGLETEWRVIYGQDEFFDVTKAIHNALQGDDRGLSSDQERIFREYNQLNAKALDGEWDVVIVHDPQPAAVIEWARERSAHWIWRCHIDLSRPNRDVLEFLAPWIERFDAAIFHRLQYVPRGVPVPSSYIWPPAIDPLAPKNMALSAEDAAYIVDQFGVDVERPLVTQVSRFDPWKDPLGVIEAWRLLRAHHPNVQLALVGSMAHDDPEGWEYYTRTVEAAAGDPDVYILSNLNNVGSVEVNAFQVHSRAVIQKSVREGFGLTVTEALWKSRPVVAGRVGGIVDQIQNGETGYLVESVEACADALGAILDDPAAAHRMALRGKEYVRQHFLTPRLLRDWLALMNLLAGRETAESRRLVSAAAG